MEKLVSVQQAKELLQKPGKFDTQLKLVRQFARENVVYRRYNKFRWTLTNKNGREADEYELTV